MSRTISIAPSLLAADFLHLEDDIRKVEAAGADMLHFDVMDAHFVPNLSMGIAMLEQIRKITPLYLDVHLMMDNAHKFIEAFAQAGADGITVHLEVYPEPEAVLDQIGAQGKDRGLVINPAMPVEKLTGKLDKVDRLLLMGVFPGFGGQKFIPETLVRLQQARELLDREGKATTQLQIDGGVGAANAKDIVAAGADCLVAGTAVFRAQDPAAAIRQLRGQ